MALSRLTSVAAAVAATVLVAASLPSFAHSYKTGDLTIGHPWSRATVGTARPGVAYLSVTNAGKDSDRLLSAQSPVCARVELHETQRKDGMMSMAPIAAVEIPAGGKVALAPGGIHLMLVGLKRPLVEGERVPMTLVFEKAGKLAVELKVEPLGGPTKGDGADHGGGHGHH